jgi:hypothetical protein
LRKTKPRKLSGFRVFRSAIYGAVVPSPHIETKFDEANSKGADYLPKIDLIFSSLFVRAVFLMGNKR